MRFQIHTAPRSMGADSVSWRERRTSRCSSALVPRRARRVSSIDLWKLEGIIADRPGLDAARVLVVGASAGIGFELMEVDAVGQQLAEVLGVTLPHPGGDVPDPVLDPRGTAWPRVVRIVEDQP